MRRGQDTEKHREDYPGTGGQEAHVLKPRRKVSGSCPCDASSWACSIMLAHAVTKPAAREADILHKASSSQHPTGALFQSLPLWEEAS